MTAQTYIQQLNTEAAGEALSALCVLGKTKAGREEINGLLGDRLPLHRAAQSPTPKVRKNAYRLMGTLEDKRDLPALRAALQQAGNVALLRVAASLRAAACYDCRQALQHGAGVTNSLGHHSSRKFSRHRWRRGL